MVFNGGRHILTQEGSLCRGGVGGVLPGAERSPVSAPGDICKEAMVGVVCEMWRT